MTIQGAQQLKQQTASIKKQTVDLALVSATRRETSGVLSPDVLGVWVVAAVVVACATTTQGVEDPRYSGGVETCEVAPWREIRGRDSVHCLVHVPGGALWASIAGGIRVLGISDSHTRQAAGSGGVVASLDERSSWGAQLGAYRVVSMAACHWLSLFSCLLTQPVLAGNHVAAATRTLHRVRWGRACLHRSRRRRTLPRRGGGAIDPLCRLGLDIQFHCPWDQTVKFGVLVGCSAGPTSHSRLFLLSLCPRFYRTTAAAVSRVQRKCSKGSNAVLKTACIGVAALSAIAIVGDNDVWVGDKAGQLRVWTLEQWVTAPEGLGGPVW